MDKPYSKTPIALRIADYAKLHRPKPKTGMEDEYRQIRNRLRKYSANSIVACALHLLWNEPKDPVEAVGSMPWLTLLIVKWALQDGCVSLRIGPPMPLAEMHRIRQQLWELSDGQQDGKAPASIFLMIRSLLHVQLEFQRKESVGFLRWPALYARLPSNHTCRQQFRAAFGVEPSTFMDVSFALYAAVLGGEMPILPKWFAPLRASYGEAVDRVCEVLARSELDLRHELQKDRAQKLRGKYELYEFPYVKRFPLVRLKDGRLHTWHRLVFARGIEEAVHLRLSDQFGEKYAYAFSRVYEDYVVELTQDAPGDRLTEGDFKVLVGGDVPSVETVLGFETCNVLIEAKMSLFSDEVLLLDQQEAIFRKTKRIREGIAQGWKVGSLLRTDARFGARFQKARDYLLVVTSRELLLSGGLMMKELYVEDALAYPDDAAAQRLPLCNVFVLSIDDFEHLTACAVDGLIDLPEFLREAAEANAGGGQTARLLFSQFLREAVPHWRRPKLLDASMQASERRIVAGLRETM